MASVLFVCLGNICRSPAAEGILRHMVKEEPRLNHVHIESCGMGRWHMGQLPDSRIREAIKERGIFLTSKAQSFKPEFLDRFDYILAADREVLADLMRYAKKPEHQAKIHLMTHFSSAYLEQEVPDPYYRGQNAFELVLDMLEDSCRGLMTDLLKRIEI